MTGNSRWENEYLRRLLEYRVKALQFLSNRMKAERERSVCRAFLRCLGIKFMDQEIITSKEEPVDVLFRAARFQVRELLELDRKRGDEFKKSLKEIRSANSIDDALVTFTSPKSIDFSEVIPCVSDALRKKSINYGTECKNLDILVYVNLMDRFLSPTSTIRDLGELETQGWRSVSFVFIPYAVVLYAKESAPDFLKEVVGLTLNKWPQPDGWFEE